MPLRECLKLHIQLLNQFKAHSPKLKLMKTHNFTDRNVLNVRRYRLHDNNKLNINDLTDPYAILGTVFAHCLGLLLIVHHLPSMGSKEVFVVVVVAEN